MGNDDTRQDAVLRCPPCETAILYDASAAAGRVWFACQRCRLHWSIGERRAPDAPSEHRGFERRQRYTGRALRPTPASVEESAAAKQQDQQDDDHERGGIHDCGGYHTYGLASARLALNRTETLATASSRSRSSASNANRSASSSASVITILSAARSFRLPQQQRMFACGGGKLRLQTGAVLPESFN